LIQRVRLRTWAFRDGGCIPLKGALEAHWAVWVDHRWRLTFRFEDQDAVLVDYQDYH